MSLSKRASSLGGAAGLLVVALGLLPGCKGCAPKKAAEPPVRFVDKTAPAVVEVPDLGVIAQHRAKVVAMLQGVATAPQLDELTKSITRELGFDPSTAEGLAKAGLPDHGPLAVQVLDGGALVIVPVVDANKLAAIVTKAVSTRFGATAAERDVEGAKVTVHSRPFGPDTVPVASFATKDGLAFVGFGRGSPEAVGHAIALPAEGSIRNHAEYRALDQALGSKGVLRLIAPSPGPLRDAVLDALASRLPFRKEGMKANANSFGASLSAVDSEIRVESRVRLPKAELDRASSILKAKSSVPDTVASVGSLPGVVFLEASGDLKALLELAGLEDPGFKTRLEEASTRMRERLGLELDRDVLAHLGGSGALTVGLRNAAALRDLQAVMANPFSFVWTYGSFAFSDADAKILDDAIEKLGPELERAGIKRERRTTPTGVADSFALASPGLEVLVARSKSSVSFTNDPGKLDEAKPSKGSLLAGRPGFAAELRFAPVVEALGAIDLDAVASGGGGIMVRGIVEKARAVLSRFDRTSTVMTLTDDGVALEGRLVFTRSK
ncbi:MAG: hypothetical protein HYV07_14845 [Deltaproteobacteria bacterium]|nr:hypothetical protein [Deltaproteobacteria bacterium]